MKRWLDRFGRGRSPHRDPAGDDALAGDLVVESVSAGYGEPILHDISIRVPAATTTVLLGHSGGGKTTLLSVIAGLIRPASGRMAIGGRELNDVPPHRRGVAMLFQNDGLYPHLDVAGNLRLPLRRRCPGGEIQGRIDSIAAAAGISDWLGRRPETLSGGQRRRVALAKAFATPAAVRLLDEPMAGIDAAQRVGLITSLDQWDERFNAAARPATLWVTHDGDEAMWRGDRVAVLDAGRLVQTGSPSDVFDRPGGVTAAEALAMPPINWFDSPDRIAIGCRAADLKIGARVPPGAGLRHRCRVVSVVRVRHQHWCVVESIDPPARRWIAVNDQWPAVDGSPGSSAEPGPLWCWVDDRDVLRFDDDAP